MFVDTKSQAISLLFGRNPEQLSSTPTKRSHWDISLAQGRGGGVAEGALSFSCVPYGCLCKVLTST